MSPAIVNSSTTGPAALRIATTPRIASGSSTSWTQRGRITGATRAGGGSVVSGSFAITHKYAPRGR